MRLTGTLLAGDAAALEETAKLVPWQSVDLTEQDNILELLESSSAVDQTVHGIDHMPGGQISGYKRWEAFRSTGLSSYAAKRNNPMLR